MPARTRVDPSGSSNPVVDQVTHLYHNSASTNFTYNRGVVGSTRVMTDIVTPRFGGIVDGGGIVNNPMTQYSGIVWQAPKEAAIRRGGTLSTGTWKGSDYTALSAMATQLPIDSIPTNALGDSSDLETAAITEAFAGVAAPDVQGIVSVAEARQALEMLRNPVKGLIDAVQRGKRKNPRKAIEGASDQWLITNFGLIPFLMDIQGAMKALSRTVDQRARETSRSVQTEVYEQDWEHFSYSNATFTLRGSGTAVDSTLVRAGVLYEHELTLWDRLGLHPSHIPAALWELKGWSFLIDYLFNVGDVVGALSPKVRTNRLAAWCVVRKNVDVTATCTAFELTGAALSSNFSVTKSPVGGYGTGTYRLVSRRPVDLSDTGLVFLPDLSAKRVANLVALAIQQLKSVRIPRTRPRG